MSRRNRFRRRRFARHSRAGPRASPPSRGLLPDGVLAYIDRNRLYRAPIFPRMRLNRLQQTAVTALEDIKARDITVLDVRKLTSLYDTLIIASADSNAAGEGARAPRPRQAEGSAAPRSSASKARKSANGCWSIAGDIVVHVMQPAVRAYYNLEELWRRRHGARSPRVPPHEGNRAARCADRSGPLARPRR